MSTKQERAEQRRADQGEARQAEQKKEEAGLLEAVIRETVMHGLGEPEGLHRVQVRQLWDHYYRVNVFVGGDAVSSKVAHSYFVAANGDGKILSSSPAIARLY